MAVNPVAVLRSRELTASLTQGRGDQRFGGSLAFSKRTVARHPEHERAVGSSSGEAKVFREHRR
jgi:hypothetical protein